MTDCELIQMALEELEEHADVGYGSKTVLQVLRDRLAQPEPEPAFYVIQATDRFGEGYEQTYWKDPLGFPVYTAPPHCDSNVKKREWVGLTGEEVGGLTVFDGLTHIEVPILAEFVYIIEAKLKEKNT